MNSDLTPPRPRSARLSGAAIVLIGLAVAAGVAFPVTRLGVGEPTSFGRLTVENPSPYIVNVDVTGPRRDGWLDVGSFRRERRRTVEELADQGTRWVFRFSSAGVDGGEVVISRDQLARDGWRMTVPPEVAQRLREAGLPESAL